MIFIVCVVIYYEYMYIFLFEVFNSLYILFVGVYYMNYVYEICFTSVLHILPFHLQKILH